MAGAASAAERLRSAPAGHRLDPPAQARLPGADREQHQGVPRLDHGVAARDQGLLAPVEHHDQALLYYIS